MSLSTPLTLHKPLVVVMVGLLRVCFLKLFSLHFGD